MNVKLNAVCGCFRPGQDEDEVPDDETINQMLARTEEEFDLYQVGAHLGFQQILRWLIIPLYKVGQNSSDISVWFTVNHMELN